VSELHRALAEIKHIRCQVARDTQFRGYGPASVAASGVLALVVAALQSHWLRNETNFHEFASVWIATALLSLTMVTIQMMFRARRVHSGLATEMVLAAAEQFLPALVVGTLLTAVVLGAAPRTAWMLPGLWQLLFSLGVFASCRFLPRLTFAVGVWYLISGLTTLIVQGESPTLLPWTMGIAFGVGQLLVAAVFQYGYESYDEQA
jgi:hypothetical protein